MISINNSITKDIKIENSLATEYIFYDLLPANTPFLIRLHLLTTSVSVIVQLKLSKKHLKVVRSELNKSSFVLTLSKKILVPRRPPSIIRVDSINETSVKIYWNSLAFADQGGFITNYKVKRNSSIKRNLILFI